MDRRGDVEEQSFEGHNDDKVGSIVQEEETEKVICLRTIFAVFISGDYLRVRGTSAR
jgi:hypothetical protein